MTSAWGSGQGRDWLVLTGDVVIQRPLTAFAPGVRNLLTDAEVTFVNLEAPLSTAPPVAEKAATQRAHPDRGKDLIDLGVNVVTLANNHLMDCGPQGYRDTLSALDAAGITAVGAGDDDAHARHHAVLASSQGDVAVLGLCAALPPGFAATPERPGVAPIRVRQQVSLDPALAAEQPGMAPFVHTQAVEADVDAACEAIAAARRDASWVVVGVHWGIPEGFAPRSYGVLAQYQRPLAHRLVDAGADLIVGHHPHAVHPLEVYRGRLIAYSLGNLVFHNWTSLGQASPPAPDADVDLGHAFPVEIPTAPYQNPFTGEATRQSVVVCARREGDVTTYRFVPTVMVDGEPAVADQAQARDALRRLTDPPLGDWDNGAQAEVAITHDDTLDCLIGVATA